MRSIEVAAITAGELGVPAVVGAGKAIDALKTGTRVTVSYAGGGIDRIYSGTLAFEVGRISTDLVPQPKTQIIMNIGNLDKQTASSAFV